MGLHTSYKSGLALAFVGALAACGSNSQTPESFDNADLSQSSRLNKIETNPENTIWNLFNKKSQETNVSVNKYLWSASLEVLNFLPVQSIDPFTGVIVTGYGTPPGGGTSYRATVLIDDPALDARSLNLALQSRGGRTVSKATSRAVEDAILSRAREMRIADSRF